MGRAAGVRGLGDAGPQPHTHTPRVPLPVPPHAAGACKGVRGSMREGSSVRVSCGPGVGGARVRAAKVSTCQSRAEPHKQPNLRATPEMGKWDPGVVSSRPPLPFPSRRSKNKTRTETLGAGVTSDRLQCHPWHPRGSTEHGQVWPPKTKQAPQCRPFLPLQGISADRPAKGYLCPPPTFPPELTQVGLDCGP